MILSLLLATACSRVWPHEVACAASGEYGSGGFLRLAAGEGHWSGKRADPGEDDGPFATVGRAREAVRALLKTLERPASPSASSCVRGTYYLDSPLEFGPEDSGSGTPRWSMPRRRARGSP